MKENQMGETRNYENAIHFSLWDYETDTYSKEVGFDLKAEYPTKHTFFISFL